MKPDLKFDRSNDEGHWLIVSVMRLAGAKLLANSWVTTGERVDMGAMGEAVDGLQLFVFVVNSSGVLVDEISEAVEFLRTSLDLMFKPSKYGARVVVLSMFGHPTIDEVF